MLALALPLAALPTSPAAGQTPSGRVAHHGAILVQAVDTSINPIAAEIVLPAFGLGVRLSDEGIVMLLNIPDGTYLVQARHIGHRPEWRVVRITGDTARLEFVLPPAEPARGSQGYGLAESRLREFLRRSVDLQQASFITRAEIERRRPKSLAALLGRLPDIAVDGSAQGPVVRSAHTTPAQCNAGMLVFVDGMLPTVTAMARGLEEAVLDRPPPRGGLRPERATFGAGIVGSGGSAQRPLASARDVAGAASRVSSGPTSPRRMTSPLEWVPIAFVAGVEIYPTVADIPPEFRVSGSECGAVLVWTIRK
jgi:hypothetical protein